MSDERTPEQRDAVTAFETAVAAMHTAFDDEPGLLMEWVLVTTQHIADGEGASTGVTWWVREGQPLVRSLGVLEYARLRVQAEVAVGRPAQDP